MTIEEIKNLQAKIGTKVDGLWGPKSKAAVGSYLRSKAPKVIPWPHTSQKSLKAFYGDPWDNEPIIMVDAPDWLRLYNEDQPIQFITCHKKVAKSLLRALESAYEAAPNVVKKYYGCHVDRRMRGGHQPSLHAYGAAIDLDAGTNRNMQLWPHSATMPIEVMEAFASEGWLCAGAIWGRDAMHFQATQW